MKVLDLMSIGSSASKLTLQSSPEEIAPFLEKLGINDMAMVEKVLMAARMASGDPTETIGSFVKNGGLMRLLAGTPAQEGEELGEVVLECPHCGEHIIY